MVDPFGTIVHRCEAMRALVERARQAVRRIDPILIEGESGTGKERLARAIHDASSRRDKPFLVVECAAIDPRDATSELIGYARGGFTYAAHRWMPGVLERASHGTVLLCDIDRIPLAAQAKLLDALETLTLTAIHEHARRIETVRVEARVIASSSRSLEEEVREGRFHKGLRARLSGTFLRVPPLRERLEDVPALVAWFLSQRPLPVSAKGLSDEALARIQRHAWSGNLRELEAVWWRGYLLSEDRPVIEADDLFAE